MQPTLVWQKKTSHTGQFIVWTPRISDKKIKDRDRNLAGSVYPAGPQPEFIFGALEDLSTIKAHFPNAHTSV